MRKLNVFNFLSLDGYYKDANNDMSWHKHGPEEAAFSAENLKADNILLFGRVTYDMMAGFWPSEAAMQYSPEVAEGMNKAEKIVISRTLKQATWNNTRIYNENIVEEIKTLKQTSGKDITILGSGSLVTFLAGQGLIDTYQLMIDPVAIGNGTPLFKGLKQPLELKLRANRTFKSGTVLLTYESVSK